MNNDGLSAIADILRPFRACIQHSIALACQPMLVIFRENLLGLIV